MNVALLGFGVVGQGVYQIIKSDFPEINIKAVLVKHPDKHIDIKSLLVNDLDEIINDDSIDVVIECISSKSFAYKAVKQALMSKKHVITANKAIISDYFQELTELAKKHQVQLLYEASVGAAIICLDPIKTISKINHLYQIDGIINGSTNYILSRIFKNDISMDKAIQEARERGYLETGSDDDMSGLDGMRKINILSMLGYHTYINENEILRIPLSNLSNHIIEFVKANDLLIKYIAKSTIKDNHLSIIVEPVVIHPNDLLAQINYEDNIINVYGKYHQKQSFIGEGAGRYPTAQAMIYDLVKIIEGASNHVMHTQTYEVKHTENAWFLVEDFDGYIDMQQTNHLQLLNNKNIKSFIRMGAGVNECL